MNSVELPKYRCHKEVYAVKIKTIKYDSDLAVSIGRETDGSAMIIPEGKGYEPIKVNHEYVRKHKPQEGGYYIVYKDGYKSYSPAKAFEEGYSLID